MNSPLLYWKTMLGENISVDKLEVPTTSTLKLLLQATLHSMGESSWRSCYGKVVSGKEFPLFTTSLLLTTLSQSSFSIGPFWQHSEGNVRSAVLSLTYTSLLEDMQECYTYAGICMYIPFHVIGNPEKAVLDPREGTLHVCACIPSNVCVCMLVEAELATTFSLLFCIP